MAFNVLTPRLIVPHLTLLSGPFRSLSLFLALFIRIAALALFSPASLSLSRSVSTPAPITFTLEHRFLLSA